uniref:Uncharacterized protein n=1 Tax=Solanum lycopersicum TaxID=4081 RepID=A0A3Q7GDB8_SOLLC
MVFCILLSYPLSILPSVSLSSSLVLLLNRSSCGHTKNLARDYWSSMYFMKLQEDIRMRAVDPEMEHASDLKEQCQDHGGVDVEILFVG